MAKKRVLTLERPDGTKGPQRSLLRSQPKKERPVSGCSVEADSAGTDSKMVLGRIQERPNADIPRDVVLSVPSLSSRGTELVYYDDGGHAGLRFQSDWPLPASDAIWVARILRALGLNLPISHLPPQGQSVIWSAEDAAKARGDDS